MSKEKGKEWEHSTPKISELEIYISYIFGVIDLPV